MARRYSDYIVDLKSMGYDASKIEEEMVVTLPDKRVDPSKYHDLVHHWCSKRGHVYKTSNRNKRSRPEYEDLHCIGTKNLSRFIHEDELKKLMVEAQSSKGSQIVPNYTNWKNDIYSKVKGPDKRGHVRYLDKLSPKSSYTSFQSSTAEHRFQKLDKVLGNLVSFLRRRFP
ncbi:hypothetical protein GmHk_01G001564 [Glycine max]|nr:hypothetical protein GmHk_01G001564 [Glycine max]